MTGRVVLVGGGPGDPDLITIRGLDRLMAADVVIADRLGPVGLLERLGPHVEVIDAARTPDRATLSYAQIGDLMIDRARAGKLVVRLKGGDPFVFAHGSEEVRSCTDAGLEVEVVPGVTSATAAPVLAGIPLTATRGASGFTVVSGHLDPDDPTNKLDWTALARSGTTLVVLMGMRQLRAISARLVADGVPADTPCACVADASTPAQRAVHAPLAELAAAVTDAGLTNPAVIVIDAGPRRPARRTLILGGARSGKSHFAETLAADAPAVTYVATAHRRDDDPEWDERIDRHRARRPTTWTTIETGDLAETLRQPGDRCLLIDSVTTWLSRAMDDAGYWTGSDEPTAEAVKTLQSRMDEVADAWSTASAAIAVSDEIGSGVVPATLSGRLFRDALGELNQRLAAAADHVYIVVAGIGRRIR